MHHEPAPGLYRHYKGGEYRVIGTAHHSETDEPMVVYRCLYYNDSLWVRPLAMFLETVTVDGAELPRFSLVAPDHAGGPVAMELIAGLGLTRHPEGGWYRETYRAAGTIPGTLLPEQVAGERSFSTAIYFLLSGAIFRPCTGSSPTNWAFLPAPPDRACDNPGGRRLFPDAGE